MFHLKLEVRDFEIITRLALEKGMDAERTARLAFKRGVRLLASTKDGREDNPGRRPRMPLEEIQNYIRLNWENQSDEVMAQALGYGKAYVCQIRCKMGLTLQIGRHHKSRLDKTKPNDSSLQISNHRQQRKEQLDALIREHWKEKSDSDIGLIIEPHVPGSRVMIQRLALGLKHKRGGMAKGHDIPTLAEQVDPIELDRMINYDGYTMTEYLRVKGFNYSRERIRQVATILGIKHAPYDRVPEWKLHRRARYLGNPLLANREWLEERLSKAVSVTSLSAELGVEDYDIFIFIRGLGLTHPGIRKHGVMTVELTCAKCGTKFKRLQRWVDRAIKQAQADGKEHKFFCGQSCAGKGNTKNHKKYHDSYIREHWLEMSDEEMATALKISPKTILRKRHTMRLNRRKIDKTSSQPTTT